MLRKSQNLIITVSGEKIAKLNYCQEKLLVDPNFPSLIWICWICNPKNYLRSWIYNPKNIGSGIGIGDPPPKKSKKMKK